MPGGNKNIKPEDGKQFSSEYQPEEKWTEKKALDLGKELIEWMHEKDENNQDKGNIFFEEFLIMVKDLYPELISYLCNKFSSFLKLIKKARKLQELKLYKYGVADRLNAQITKFVLINEHGKLSDNSKSENKNTNINSKELTKEEMKEFNDILENEY